jgi:hypothetical protein
MIALAASQRAGPMLTSTKKLDNSLENKAEPEQLELFGQDHPSRESASMEEYLSPIVCNLVANAVGCYYGLTAAENTNFCKQVVGLYSSEQAVSAWTTYTDYLDGFASTMSSVPITTQQTFIRSDRDALASDWMTVQSNLNRVWQTITGAERICYERTGQQRKRRQASHAE